MKGGWKAEVYRLVYLLFWRWASLRTFFHRPCKPGEVPKMVLVPCEPWSITGSRGDQAMIVAIVQDFKRRFPQGEMIIVSGVRDNAKVKTGALADARVEWAWRGRVPLKAIFELLKRERPVECYVLGADCMDGHYSVRLSLVLLAAADLSARLGIVTHLTGFSFNDHPAKGILSCFRRATPRLKFCLRDEVSLQRFRSMTGCDADLVADVAFLLEPEYSTRSQAYRQWAQREQARGQCVLGINLHGMLFAGNTVENKVLDGFVQQLTAFMAAREKVSLLFVPHDFRDGGDLVYLAPVYEAVTARVGRAAIIREELSASELKGICGNLDGLVTSRMHLGIAAFGMGVPVMGFVYQGKFAGLWRHFGLPEVYCFSPELIATDALAERLKAFYAELAGLRAQVARRLPHVKALAGLNLKCDLAGQ